MLHLVVIFCPLVFNNSVMICWLTITTKEAPTLSLPATYTTFWHGFCCYQNASTTNQLGINNVSVYNKTLNSFVIRIAAYTLEKAVITIGV